MHALNYNLLTFSGVIWLLSPKRWRLLSTAAMATLDPALADKYSFVCWPGVTCFDSSLRETWGDRTGSTSIGKMKHHDKFTRQRDCLTRLHVVMAALLFICCFLAGEMNLLLLLLLLFVETHQAKALLIRRSNNAKVKQNLFLEPSKNVSTSTPIISWWRRRWNFFAWSLEQILLDFAAFEDLIDHAQEVKKFVQPSEGLHYWESNCVIGFFFFFGKDACSKGGGA